MLVINSFKFFLLEAKKHPHLPMNPKHQNFPQFQKQSPTFALGQPRLESTMYLLSGTLYCIL